MAEVHDLSTRLHGAWQDLAAPGDRARWLPPERFGVLSHVSRPDGTRFRSAYDALFDVFGPAGEMEPEPVIRERLRVARHTATGDTLHYRLATMTDETGTQITVRDHTVIHPVTEENETVVHLSHALVLPAFRGRGLGAILRTLPLLDAIDTGADPCRVTLVAEMEPHNPDADAATRDDQHRRLRVYESAGFRMLDPGVVGYAQPCFTGEDPAHTPLPMRLVVRRVRREKEPTCPADEAVRIVESLYGMYAMDLARAAIETVSPRLEHLREHDAPVRLLPPSSDA